jgi:hypothetical protein
MKITCPRPFGRFRFRGGVPGEALMSVLEDDVLARAAGHGEFDLSVDSTVRSYRPIAVVLRDFAIVAVSVWLCVGVSWWFLPLSVLVIGGVQRLSRNAELNVVLGAVYLRPHADRRFVLVGVWALIFGAAAVFGWLPFVLLFWFVPMVIIGWLSGQGASTNREWRSGHDPRASCAEILTLAYAGPK